MALSFNLIGVKIRVPSAGDLTEYSCARGKLCLCRNREDDSRLLALFQLLNVVNKISASGLADQFIIILVRDVRNEKNIVLTTTIVL